MIANVVISSVVYTSVKIIIVNIVVYKKNSFIRVGQSDLEHDSRVSNVVVQIDELASKNLHPTELLM